MVPDENFVETAKPCLLRNDIHRLIMMLLLLVSGVFFPVGDKLMRLNAQLLIYLILLYV